MIKSLNARLASCCSDETLILYMKYRYFSSVWIDSFSFACDYFYYGREQRTWFRLFLLSKQTKNKSFVKLREHRISDTTFWRQILTFPADKYRKHWFTRIPIIFWITNIFSFMTGNKKHDFQDHKLDSLYTILIYIIYLREIHDPSVDK